MTRCPAILIAAPASGQGKTTVTSALARLHTRQGRKVRVFKCGPDFLDPYWHTLASGAPVYQLDLWMTGEADCRARLHAAAQEADLIIVEGVMGLFDGEPSAADLAQRFGLPVLAVVDASAMAGTFGALAFGLQHYRADMPWAGVLANRVASARHAAHAAGQRARAGALSGRGDAQRRHDLARAPPGPDRGRAKSADAMERLDAAADALAATPLGQMTLDDLQRWAVDFAAAEDGPEGWSGRVFCAGKGGARKAGGGHGAEHSATQPSLHCRARRIAVARDAAFCFIYAANLDTLRELGAELVFFSPLADTALPACDAVWLPGGYPELHAALLAANTGLRDSLRAHVARGLPVWAECGGMMLLFEELVQTEGTRQALWGLLPGNVTMQKRLAALGPQQLALDGRVLRGHTFHYSTCDTPLPAQTRTSRPDTPIDASAGEALWVSGSIRASYFHAWFASHPQATADLFSSGPEPVEARP